MKPKIKTTCTKLQLQLLSFCLLCLSGKTRCDGNGPDVVTVEQDSDAVLPCSLSSKEDIQLYLFDWKKPAQIDGRQKEVFYYDAGVTYDSGRAGQSEEFKGRVSHFPQELKHGNASIIIRNTMVADSGNYTCVFPRLQPRQTFHIELVVEPVVVKVEEDGDALLPCSHRTNKNIEQGHFDWNKLAQNGEKLKEVFLYENGKHSHSFGSQDDEFKGRVFHFPQELKHGNASIIIRNTTVADSGVYTCTFTEPRKTFHIKLVVGAASKPNIRTLDQTDNRALLQCEVHGHPEPEVEWRDSAGKTLPAQKSLVKEKGKFFITLNTTVTKTDRYRCVATQKEISHQLSTETIVRLNGAAKKPFITTLEQTKDWSRLQCVVRGASSKPKVEWKDSSGNILPAEPQVTDRGGSYDIILQTTVTRTDYYHCVVTQEDIKHQAEAKIHVYISGPTVISVYKGDALTLPCSLSTKKNIESEMFEWKKDGQKVFLYDAGTINGRSGQREEFKGRVFHFPDNLKHGDASITIRNTELTDSGNYTCDFPRLQPRPTFHIKLVVTGNSGSGANSSGSTGWIVVVSVICTLLVVGVILAVLVHKRHITLHCDKGSPADHKEGSAVPLKSQPSQSQEAPDPET